MFRPLCEPSSGCDLVYYTFSWTQLYFTQQYSRGTTTCFGPICGPSSGCDLVYYTFSWTQLYFTQQYSRDTTTCFGPICGPSSGCTDHLYKNVWSVLWGYWELGGGTYSDHWALKSWNKEIPPPPTQPPVPSKNTPHVFVQLICKWNQTWSWPTYRAETCSFIPTVLLGEI